MNKSMKEYPDFYVPDMDKVMCAIQRLRDLVRIKIEHCKYEEEKGGI